LTLALKNSPLQEASKNTLGKGRLSMMIVCGVLSIMRIFGNPSVTRIEEASEPVNQGLSPDLSALKG